MSAAVETLRGYVALTKPRILELYLNLIEWGNGVFGCELAAQNAFGKSAAELSREEAAALAAVIAGKAAAPGQSPVAVDGLPASACVA